MRIFFKLYRRLRIFYYARLSNNVCKGAYNSKQPVLFLGEGKVLSKGLVQFGYYPSPFYWNGYCHVEARKKDAVIEFGNNIFINNNFVLIAESGNVKIGDNCLIGTNVEILNSDFHGLSIKDRHSGKQHSKNILIGENVFIGNNVKIMKGVTIGDNSVIANGSVVFESVAPNTVVRGNPAKYYKTLYE